MEFRQLSYFLEIAQSGSFSKAAVRLSVAQPILSRQIKLLESELGVELLYRNGRGIVLSEVGKLLDPMPIAWSNSWARRDPKSTRCG
jgi:LysR family transcriptional regulator, nitrogen assimilation regulatory protein